MSGRLDAARQAWGGQVPQCVEALAQAVDNGSSLRKLAAIVGYSTTTLSQVLSNKYPGKLDRIGKAIEVHLSPRAVTCPLLGEISARECAANQGREFGATSAARVALWKACKVCDQRLTGV